MLKAWQVDRGDEEESCIVFAETRGKARDIGACELSDDFMHVMGPRRVPWADKYADTGYVPQAEKLAHGWWRSCEVCGEQVDEGSIADGGKLIGEATYCPMCVKMLGGAE